MAKKNVFGRIQRYNDGRDPERLMMKLQTMRGSVFAFLRGTCHLFYEDLPRDCFLRKAPITWICGDLHLENFGSFKGDNRLVYFDMNDFDEAVLAPCTWELLRFLVSVIIAADTLRVNESEVIGLCLRFLNAYCSALQKGKAKWVERDTAEGIVKDLLDGLRERRRKDFLDKRTERRGKSRKIKIDGKRALAVTNNQRHAIEAFMKAFAATQTNPAFFTMLDVAKRIAGTGSLGVDRYIILIEGKGSPNENYLLDLKEMRPSSLKPYLEVKQPKWPAEAERVVAIQRRMQAVAPAFLQPVTLGRKSYLLRSLQPSEDRIDLNLWNGKTKPLEHVMQTMGEIVAWGQLRSSGRQGSAIADELIAFSMKNKWRKDLIKMALIYADKVREDWQFYCSAFDLTVTSVNKKRT